MKIRAIAFALLFFSSAVAGNSDKLDSKTGDPIDSPVIMAHHGVKPSSKVSQSRLSRKDLKNLGLWLGLYMCSVLGAYASLGRIAGGRGRKKVVSSGLFPSPLIGAFLISMGVGIGAGAKAGGDHTVLSFSRSFYLGHLALRSAVKALLPVGRVNRRLMQWGYTGAAGGAFLGALIREGMSGTYLAIREKLDNFSATLKH